MEMKDSRLTLRLTNTDILKIHGIATVSGCNMSEAVRLLVRTAQIVVKPAVVEVNKPAQGNEMVTTQ